MAFTHGKDSAFTLASVALTTFLTNVNFSASGDVAETSAMGSEAKTYISGLTDGTISLAGWFDPTNTTGPDDTIFDSLGSETAVAWEYGPQGTGTGAVKYSGNCFVTGYAATAPIGDTVAFTAELQITGAITRGAYA